MKTTTNTSNAGKMKYLFLLPLFLLLAGLTYQAAWANNAAVAQQEETVFVVVEQMPRFPGGDKALMEFLSTNVKYPKESQDNGIEGRVICTYIVEKDGSISDVNVSRGVDPLLDAEAVRVIQSFPKWEPGKQKGQAVRVKYTLPVSFKLQ